MSEQRTIHTAVISVHDVMPETLTAVGHLLNALGEIPPASVTLLVVPGRRWQQADIDWLHEHQDLGYRLAGHGWMHCCDAPQSLYHRLHSLFLSRRAAEHLSLSRSQINELVARCYGWFADQGLNSPTLYVPPAWAMGNVAKPRLQALPFGQYETLSGVYHSDGDSFDRLPLTGYEADSPSRAIFLRRFNQYQRYRAACTGLPLRIGIHPYDLRHRMANDLLKDVHSVERAMHYENYRDGCQKRQH
ncbi:polysaccharide deacetylase family protein [Haliea sp. E1-2-M8]|uniref:polysaccharide deacetylase family protein n=1 Tax=Haliea sp. E1-2-M8 TaxID=3064706 RepID=UPI002721F2EF|nr:polysaccharide deacetylase family protein [Haliea sp. E1-2-M8]MDO8861989.1 polysaccharide deacetylase family protein [Haliea sp. E1-2-M8]